MLTKKIAKRHIIKQTGRKRSNIQLTSQPSSSKNVKMEFSSSDEVDDEMDENYEESELETWNQAPLADAHKTEKYCIEL